MVVGFPLPLAAIHPGKEMLFVQAAVLVAGKTPLKLCTYQPFSGTLLLEADPLELMFTCAWEAESPAKNRQRETNARQRRFERSGPLLEVLRIKV